MLKPGSIIAAAEPGDDDPGGWPVAWHCLLADVYRIPWATAGVTTRGDGEGLSVRRGPDGR
jgi:hypothetical protein